MFKRMTLIGMGLIASSIARAVRHRGLVDVIDCHTRSQETAVKALDLGLADILHDTPESSVGNADFVILCTPVKTFSELAERIGPHLKPGAIVSDVGSVKRHVLAAITPHIPQGVHFVPAHPLAGTEESGPESGFAELFTGRWCLLTPPEGTDAAAVGKVSEFWQQLGSDVEIMTPEHHDMVLAVTSHIPHLIAYTMVGTADHMHRISNSEVIRYSAAGFRDFTRIAASNPTMWRDVFLTNRDATLDILGRFTEELLTLQRAIRDADGDFMQNYFTRTRAIRRGILEARQDTHAPDFGRHRR